ncbi:MAG TPA: NAD(P)-dependent oxidoreductase [Pseudonocardiaceae bacterium]|nr:NAD(P)-dependent oxidoreductase [Pseudonocardiaceae bacterium]
MTQRRHESVGVLGVGRIGTALVHRLVAAGHDVTAFGVRPERRAEVESAAARWADPSGCSVVFTALPGIPELTDLGHGRFLPGLAPSTIWVDLTSGSLEVGQDLARAAAEHGIGYLDAPIGGGVPALRAGTVRLYVGGDPAVLAQVEPVLGAFAATVLHMGGPGSGYLTKLLVNLLWFGSAALTTEALLLAQRHGQIPDRLREALLGSAGDSAFVADHLPALLAGDYLSDFGLDRCVEELDAIERSAADAATPHPIMSAVVDLHRAALRRYGPVDGELMASALLEEQAGTRLH